MSYLNNKPQTSDFKHKKTAYFKINNKEKNEMQERISSVKNFIKYNSGIISFLWKDTHEIHTTDPENTISGQLILELCEDTKWRPLICTNERNEVYCYVLNKYNDIIEFRSTREKADSLEFTNDNEATEKEFYNNRSHHFGKTIDQILNDIFKKSHRDNKSEYTYNSESIEETSNNKDSDEEAYKFSNPNKQNKYNKRGKGRQSGHTNPSEFITYTQYEKHEAFEDDEPNANNANSGHDSEEYEDNSFDDEGKKKKR
jgi:hypothetical protein